MVNYLHISDNFAKFVAWIGGSCKPSDKGKLTPFPRFTFCQHNFNNVSSMLKFEELHEVNSERWLSLEDLPGEVWRDVVGYEDLFSISCYGRLKRKERLTFNPHSGYCRYREKIIRNQSTDLGYQHVCICIGNNKKANLSYHRMVMEAFVPNPSNLPFINHKDENPRNNCIFLNNDGSINAEKSNLEWCTPKYNSNYGTVKARKKANRIEKGTTCHVVLYDYEGHVLKEYKTAKDAAKDNGLSRETITNCCTGFSPTAKGLHFRFKGEKYQKRTIDKFKNSIINIYKEDKLVFTSTVINRVAEFLNIENHTFLRLLFGKTKKCEKISEYTITVEKPDGIKYLIENGMINNG